MWYWQSLEIFRKLREQEEEESEIEFPRGVHCCPLTHYFKPNWSRPKSRTQIEMNDVGVIYTLPGFVVVTKEQSCFPPFTLSFNGVFVRTFTFDSLESYRISISELPPCSTYIFFARKCRILSLSFFLIDCHIRLVVSFINFLKLTQMILCICGWKSLIFSPSFPAFSFFSQSLLFDFFWGGNFVKSLF